MLLTVLTLAQPVAAARADSVSDFYKGKTVRIMVASAPGDGLAQANVIYNQATRGGSVVTLSCN